MLTNVITTLAVAPGVFLAYQVYKLDKIEKESPGLIVKLILAGIAAIVPAILIELVGTAIIDLFLDPASMIYVLAENILIVACAEEGCKYIGVRFLTWKNPEFNFRFDGVVYAVATSIGFAVLENICYSWSYGLGTAITRAVTAVPAHTIFAIFMGHYYGLAKHYENMGLQDKCASSLRKALIVPIILHGFYDVFASLEDWLSCLIFIVLVITMDIVAYKKIKKYSREDTLV